MRIPGVGKNLPERLVVELKDKLTILRAPVSKRSRRRCDDVLSALVNLGIASSLPTKALEQAVPRNELAAIRWALRAR